MLRLIVVVQVVAKAVAAMAKKESNPWNGQPKPLPPPPPPKKKK